MAKKLIKFMLTAFRDGFQSVYGARVFSKDFLPVVEEAAKAGIEHFEAGGGAMFQSPYFYSNEDSFVMMDNFRKAAGANAELQTLARGINVVALDSQPRDIVKLHAQLFKKHGITTIRNFDALNDVNNLIYSGQCIKEAGLKHEVTVTMMELPPGCEGAHTPEFYADTLRKIMEAGIPYDSVAFKDASGTSRPQKVYDTIKLARKLLGDKTKIVFHSHETAGTGTVSYKAAIEAGCDQIDLSMAPVSGGTCQPDILTMWHCLRGTDYDLGIDVTKIMKLEETFKEAMKDYFVPPEATKVESLIPFFPMPGGALTANTQMLRDNKLMDKYPEVIAAMGEAVKKGGFGTSVTPVSQFYFQQAFNNVMFGPWKKIAEGYGKMVLGYFGKTPVEPDAEVVKIAQEQLSLKPTTENPLDVNDRNPKKGIPACKKMLEEAGLPTTDENIFIAASCQEKGIAFLKGEAKVGVRKESAEKKEEKKATPNGYTVTVNNKPYAVKISGDTATVNGVSYSVNIKDGIDEKAIQQAGTGTEQKLVDSPLPGLVLRIFLKPGDKVAVGETIMVIESMKMETPINSTVSGVIEKIAVHKGEQIQSGQLLAVVNTISNAPASSITRATEAKIETKGDEAKIESPLPGLVLRIFLKPGDSVKVGETILVVESMKMETPINSAVEGKIVDILVKQGEQIQSGQVLALVKK
ncbi:MAG: biotin attachment protein [Spirochaetes bacterium GWD1_27_9]|nr:MAG: biotin attachment protein [Spirochaetes bacterium GWB1_27_13]OHD24740.1 MAG: biotin attachment protein [Spirochaetes bacterium GWC1_27_15]OHD40568.1 MAG: biotin attachment protein [Spirochaetes bacterium GWD1_27_9]